MERRGARLGLGCCQVPPGSVDGQAVSGAFGHRERRRRGRARARTLGGGDAHLERRAVFSRKPKARPPLRATAAQAALIAPWSSSG